MNRQRIGAYALTHTDERVLLCRMSADTPTPGRWTLPGGGVEHGEDPAQAALRELREETGLTGTIRRLIGVHWNVYTGPKSGDNIHGIRLIYLVEADAGPLQAENAGSTDCARWVKVSDTHTMDLSEHAQYALSEYQSSANLR